MNPMSPVGDNVQNVEEGLPYSGYELGSQSDTMSSGIAKLQNTRVNRVSPVSRAEGRRVSAISLQALENYGYQYAGLHVGQG